MTVSLVKSTHAEITTENITPENVARLRDLYEKALHDKANLTTELSRAYAEMDVKERRLAESHKTVNILNDERRTARDLADERARELAGFKRQVGLTAMRYAREHNWCDVVKEALNDMDVPVPVDRHRWQLVLTVDMVADHTGTGVVDATYIGQSTSTGYSSDDTLYAELDSDWENADILNVSAQVINHEVIEATQ